MRAVWGTARAGYRGLDKFLRLLVALSPTGWVYWMMHCPPQKAASTVAFLVVYWRLRYTKTETE